MPPAGDALTPHARSRNDMIIPLRRPRLGTWSRPARLHFAPMHHDDPASCKATCHVSPFSLVSLNETTSELMAVFVREPVFVFGRQGNRPVPQSLASSALHQCACMFTSQLAPLAMSAAAGRTMYVAGSTISSRVRKLYRPIGTRIIVCISTLFQLFQPSY